MRQIITKKLYRRYKAEIAEGLKRGKSKQEIKEYLNIGRNTVTFIERSADFEDYRQIRQVSITPKYLRNNAERVAKSIAKSAAKSTKVERRRYMSVAKVEKIVQREIEGLKSWMMETFSDELVDKIQNKCVNTVSADMNRRFEKMQLEDHLADSQKDRPWWKRQG